MPSATDNPVNNEEVVVVKIEPPPAEVNHGAFNFAIAFLLKCIGYIVSLLEHFTRFCINYYTQLSGEEAVIMPPSPLSFTITSLYVFAEIKSQGSQFPFQTHPRSINLAITSVLFYGLASAAEHFISATRIGTASIYAGIARFGRILCLCILVASLASLLYL